MNQSRREFMNQLGAGALLAGGLPAMRAFAQSDTKPASEEPEGMKDNPKYPFDISLAAWSLHRTIGEGEGKRPMLDMPQITKEEFGIGAIELVSRMLASTDPGYLEQFAANAAKHDTKILLIMVDGEGDIGSDRERICERAVENHKKWVDIAADFGCHSIRMNWGGAPKGAEADMELAQQFIDRSVPHFRALCDYGDTKDINILIENHWGPSSYPAIMAKLYEAIDHPRMGTLPDFGNFPNDVDRYEATDVLMKWAKALSAKCYDFDPETGEDTKIDFGKMLQICCGKHGYDGWIGIEYEGKVAEPEGIMLAKALLERYQA